MISRAYHCYPWDLHSGQYTCEASNTLGSSRDSIIVVGKCRSRDHSPHHCILFYWPPLHSGFQALLRPQCWAQQQCTGDPWVPASSHWAGRQSPTAPSFNMKFSFNRFSLFFSMLIVTSAMIRKMTTSRIGKSWKWNLRSSLAITDFRFFQPHFYPTSPKWPPTWPHTRPPIHLTLELASVSFAILEMCSPFNISGKPVKPGTKQHLHGKHIKYCDTIEVLMIMMVAYQNSIATRFT